MLTPILLAATLLARQTGVEVAFRRGENAIIVDAAVNGRDLSLMFDTGFSGAVDVDDNIDIGKPTGKLTLRDFVRETEASTVKISSLTLGKKRIDPEGLVAVLSPPSDYSFAFNTHCDGLMGFETIFHEVTEINFQRNTFVFYPHSYDISKRVPDNKHTFLLNMLPTGRGSIELQAVTPSGKSLTLALDTGNAFYATTHRDVLERIGLWDGREAKYPSLAGVASGAVASWSVKMPPLTIFGVPVASSVWDVIDLPSSSAQADGTVGYGFLSNFNITVDYERRRVWLENFTDKTGNEPEGETGIYAGYSRSQKSVVVAGVAPESPAEKIGIKNGDQILSLDGVDLGRKTGRQMRLLLRGPVASKVKLVLSRNGILHRYEIERQPLLNLAAGVSS